MLGRSNLVLRPPSREDISDLSCLEGSLGSRLGGRRHGYFYWCIYTFNQIWSEPLLHSAVTDNSAPYTVTPHILLCTERELLTDRARRFVFEVRILSCALALHFQWLLSWLWHRKVICHQLEVICYQPSP